MWWKIYSVEAENKYATYIFLDHLCMYEEREKREKKLTVE